MRTHIINGHYMFGNTFMQPDMPYYNHFKHHIMAPINRPMPPYPDIDKRPGSCPATPGKCLCFETENGSKVDCPYIDPDEISDGTKCENCDLCKPGIIRDPLAYSVVNIETSVLKTLKITLYGTSKDLDKTVEMKVGNRYSITYITEQGLVTSVGYLELISDSVPDKCTRYIGGTNSVATASTAYIGMDCSTEGHSDKRKIYIASIRYIQALEEDEVIDPVEVKSLRDRLQELLDAIEKGELVFCNKDCGCTEKPKEPPTEPEDPDNPPVVDPDDPGKGDEPENPDNPSVNPENPGNGDEIEDPDKPSTTDPDNPEDGSNTESIGNKDNTDDQEKSDVSELGTNDNTEQSEESNIDTEIANATENDTVGLEQTVEQVEVASVNPNLKTIDNTAIIEENNAKLAETEAKLQELLDAIEDGKLVWKSQEVLKQEAEYTTPYKTSTAFIPTPDMVLDDTKNVVRMDAKLLGI